MSNTYFHISRGCIAYLTVVTLTGIHTLYISVSHKSGLMLPSTWPSVGIYITTWSLNQIRLLSWMVFHSVSVSVSVNGSVNTVESSRSQKIKDDHVMLIWVVVKSLIKCGSVRFKKHNQVIHTSDLGSDPLLCCDRK